MKSSQRNQFSNEKLFQTNFQLFLNNFTVYTLRELVINLTPTCVGSFLNTTVLFMDIQLEAV